MALIPDEKIAEVRGGVNLVHYISQFVQLKKAGQNFKGLCPFHTEKTPSFMVSPAKQIFHCFGCGKGGNIFTFISEYEKLPFIDAVRKAADFAGIVLPKVQQDPQTSDRFQRLFHINQTAADFFEQQLYLPKNKSRLEYFLNRGLSEDTIKRFKLGFAPDSYEQMLNFLNQEKIDLAEAADLGLIQKRENKPGYYDKFRNRVIFPFHNLSGKICGFGGRRLNEDQIPKYLNSPENPIYNKGKMLYGLHQAIHSARDNGYLFLVEGYFDLLRLVEVGVKHVVASSGTALTPDQAKLIRRYTNQVYIAYDGDQAGKKAAIRNAAIIEQQDLNAFIIPMPEGEDPDTLILKKGFKAFEKLIEQKKQPVEFQIDEFLQKNATPTLDEKEQFVLDALNILVDYKNKIKTGLYVHLLSDRLQINENLLIGQLNRLQRAQWRYQKKPADQKEQSQKAEPVKIQSGKFMAERGIIALLLGEDMQVRNFLMSEVQHDFFENEIIIKIYERIILDLEETGQIDPRQIIQEFQQDTEATELLSELILDEFKDPIKYARDCIYVLKKWQLEKKSREIGRKIREIQQTGQKDLTQTAELMEIRKQISRLEKRFRGR